MQKSGSDDFISSTDEEAPVICLKSKRTVFSKVQVSGSGLVEDDEVREEALVLQLKQYEISAKEKDHEIEKLKRELAEVNKTLALTSPMSPNIKWIWETLENVYLKQGLDWNRRLDTVSSGFSPSEVGNYIRQVGRNSDEIKRCIQWVQTVIKKSLKGIKTLWTGYKPQNDVPVFVAVVYEQKDDFPTQVMNFEIIQHVEGQVSDEAKFVLSREKEKRLTFSAEEQTSISKCLAKYSTRLMREHSNLKIVSASKIKSVKHESEYASYDELTCIVLYVDVKGIIPIHEELFPSELDGIPVDVREGTFKTYGKSPAEYHEQLMMGCQIVTDYETSGTLGGFLKMENNSFACLTCCHIFETPESLSDLEKDPRNHTFLQKGVYQPFAPYKIGGLLKWVKYKGDETNIGVDAALVEILDPMRYPQSGDFPNAESSLAGFSSLNPMEFNSGEVIKCIDEVPIPSTVVKYGASTEHTIGTVRLFGPAVHVHTTSFRPEDKVRLHNQLEVMSNTLVPFSAKGDSGSLVFSMNDMKSGSNIRALGLLVGGTDYGTTIVTPIWAVLSRLNVPLQLHAFKTESSPLPTDLPTSRLDGVEKDVEILKSNVSELVVNAQQMGQKMNDIEGKIEQIGAQSLKSEQNIQNIDSKLDMQHAQLLNLLMKRNGNDS